MRIFLPRVLAVCVIVATSIMSVAAPALAQPSDAATFNAEFERIKQEMKDLWLEMHNFKPLNKYCLPPNEPTKQPHIAAMQVFGARTQALMSRYRANKQSLQDFLAGNHELERELMLNGVSPRERNYWRDNKFQIEADRLQKKFNEKDAELKAKPERNCGPTAPPKTEIEVIGGNPPLPPPPPPPPPPPVDPLAGLTRPTFEAVNIPPLAEHYCSQAEKDSALAKFPREFFKVLAQIEASESYIAALKARRAELEARGVETHWLNSMDYEVRQAEIWIADRRTTIEALKTTQALIESTPVIDCSTGKEIGWLPGWSAGIETGYGDLTIPRKPYLSLEFGGNQYLGVVDHERVASVATMLLSLTHEFDCDRLPNISFGIPRHMRWMSSAELFGYDYSVYSSNGSINTTNEGVGIPGTGDPWANFPAGVFLADPDFNDVTDINYSHKSELDGLSLGFGQKSYYTRWTSTLGLGLSYTRLETSDNLTGTVSAYPIDFGYNTDIETRNFGLFVQGGAEIAIDDYWDTALRYAGEFSGFRIAVDAKAGVNVLDAQGADSLYLSGFITDTQRVSVSKDDTTFGYQLGAALKYTPPGARALELSFGTQYGESDIHPVVNRSGQTDEQSQIEFETQERFQAFFGLRLRY